MTTDEAEEFCSDLKRLKTKWGCDICTTINENCEATFPDGSRIVIDDRDFSVGDLKPGVSKLPDGVFNWFDRFDMPIFDAEGKVIKITRSCVFRFTQSGNDLIWMNEVKGVA
jgi:hypothetical protein